MKNNLTRSVFVLCVLGCLASANQATARVRVEPGTKLAIRMDRSIGTKEFRQWHSFGQVKTVPGTLVQDVVAADGRVALRSGTKINVAVLENKRAGHLIGRSTLRLGLYSVTTPNGE